MMNLGACALMTVLAFGALVGSTGCKGNKGYDKTTNASSSLQSLANELDAGANQVKATMASLNQLMATTAGDLRPPYNRFVEEIKKLDRAADRSANARKDFESRRKAFMKAWEDRLDKISDENVRNVGAQRRDSAQDQFEKLDSTFNSVKESYDPLKSMLADIRDLLSVDLNRGAVQAARPLVEQATEDANLLLDRISVATREIRTVSDRVSPTGN